MRVYILTGRLVFFGGSYSFFFGFKSFLLDDFLEDTFCYRWVWFSYWIFASLSFFFTKLFLKSLIRLKASLFDSSSSDWEDDPSSLACFDGIFFSLKVNFFSSFANAFLLLIPCRTDWSYESASLTSEFYSSPET